jgi:hypothetical protein
MPNLTVSTNPRPIHYISNTHFTSSVAGAYSSGKRGLAITPLNLDFAPFVGANTAYRSTDYAFVSDEDFQLQVTCSNAPPVGITYALINLKTNSSTDFVPSTLFITPTSISILKNVPYVLSFRTALTGGSQIFGDVFMSSLQNLTIKGFIPGGFTPSILPNCVTTYDSNFQPTFTFTNVSLVEGGNYNVTFAYEPITSGTVVATISDPLIATTPESFSFVSGVSFFYGFQSLVTGVRSFSISISIIGVGVPTITDINTITGNIPLTIRNAVTHLNKSTKPIPIALPIRSLQQISSIPEHEEFDIEVIPERNSNVGSHQSRRR